MPASESPPPSDPPDGTSPTKCSEVLPSPASRREADDWALVLAAEGCEPTVLRSGARFLIRVPAERMPRAREVLDAYRAERRERERLRAARLPPTEPPSIHTLAMAYGLALALLVFHVGLTRTSHVEALVQLGRSQAALVLTGEWWRLITALTLHADLPHVLGNTLFGGLFLGSVAGRVGLGWALLAFVVSGTLGNLANAVYYQQAHGSIGASTGVFGLVGVLAGLAAWQRHRQAAPGRGAWVALGAGLALLAMLGSGGVETDFSAHLFGLIAGAAAGLAFAIPLGARPPPGIPSQAMAAAAALATIGLAWALALSP